MLNQAAGDRDILAEKLHISDQQLKYVTNAGRGQGLIFFGDTILPFVDRFPRDTKMYQLMTSIHTQFVTSSARVLHSIITLLTNTT